MLSSDKHASQDVVSFAGASSWWLREFWDIAQMVERLTFNQLVAGSIPAVPVREQEPHMMDLARKVRELHIALT